MRLPAAAALAWPERLDLARKGFDTIPVEKWDIGFKAINEDIFPCYKIARLAGERSGAYPSLLIGADEAAVDSFLSGLIPFTAISKVVEETLSTWNGRPPVSLDDALALVAEGQRIAEYVCKKWRHDS
ncbi:MAG: hypothetical protein Q4F74_07195 [Synergistaceae bacterium]|nr:hypothetical protein [Synergistaceae bacterium]